MQWHCMSEPPATGIGVDAAYQMAAAVTQALAGAAFYIAAARIFNATAMGAIALFMAILGLLGIIFSFGLGTAVQHFISYYLGAGDHAAVRSTIKKLLTAASALALAGLVLTVTLAGPVSVVFLHSYAYTGLVRLLGLVLLGSILFGMFNGALLGLYRFRLSAIVSIAYYALYYFGALAMAFITRSLAFVVYGWATGTLFGLFMALVALFRSIRGLGVNGSGQGPNVGVVLAYTTPIFLSNIIGYGATYVDRFVVAGLMTLSSLGVYNFALLVVSAIGVITTPFNNILLPKLSGHFGAGRRDAIGYWVKIASLLLYSLYMPVALAVAALSPAILELLGGPVYVAGSGALTVIMFFSAALVSANALSSAVMSVRRTSAFIYSSAASLMANLSASITLIPRLGLLGASLGFSAAGAASFMVLLFFLHKEGLLQFEVKGVAKVWASSLLIYMFLALVELRAGGNWALLVPSLVTAGVIYIFLIKTMRAFSKSNKDAILSMFPPSYRRLLSLLI